MTSPRAFVYQLRDLGEVRAPATARPLHRCGPPLASRATTSGKLLLLPSRGFIRSPAVWNVVCIS